LTICQRKRRGFGCLTVSTGSVGSLSCDDRFMLSAKGNVATGLGARLSVISLAASS
jgi:hypothetical protein